MEEIQVQSEKIKEIEGLIGAARNQVDNNLADVLKDLEFARKVFLELEVIRSFLMIAKVACKNADETVKRLAAAP